MKNMLTVVEVARELGVSPRRVQQLILAGDIGAERIHQKLYLVPTENVAKYKKNRSGGKK